MLITLSRFRTLFQIVLIICLVSLQHLLSIDPELVHPYEPGYPESHPWYQIKTRRFTIYAPEGLTNDANLVANYMEKGRDALGEGLGVKPYNWTLILNNSYMIANGYVNPFNRKSEWYSLPISGFNTEWFRTLAIHEGRHMAQFDSMNQGVVRAAGNIYGGYGRMLMGGWIVPDWFMEGDAIMTENLMGPYGRGTMPSFTAYYRAREKENKRLSFGRAAVGSSGYNYSASHYELGYQMVLGGELMYGTNFWREVLKRSVFSVPIYSFGRAIKKWSGLGGTTLYASSFDEMGERWEQQERTISERLPSVIFSNVPITRPSKTYKSFSSIAVGEDDQIYAVEYSYEKSPALYSFKDKRKNLSKVGYTGNSLSYANGFLLWSEAIEDVRWKLTSHNDLFLFDTKTKKTTRLSHKKNFIGSALSSDGEKVVATSMTPTREWELQFHTLVYKRLSSLGVYKTKTRLQSPIWFEDGKHVAVISKEERGDKILIFDSSYVDRPIKVLEHFSKPIDELSEHGGIIYYSSPYTGVDMIHAVNVESGKSYIVAAGKFGAKSPVAKNGFLYFKNYWSKSGWVISQKKIATNEFYPESDFAPVLVEPFRELVSAHPRANEFNAFVTNESLFTKYPIKKKKPNLFKFHAAGLYSDLTSIDYLAVSSDYLARLFLTATVGYDFLEQQFRYGLKSDYTGLYPVFSLNAERRMRSIVNFLDKGQFYHNTSFREDVATGEVKIDLSSEKNGWYRALSSKASLGAGYIERKVKALTFPSQFVLPAELQWSAQVGRSRSHKDPFSPLGVGLSASYRKMLKGFDADSLGVFAHITFTTPLTGTGFRFSASSETIRGVGYYYANRTGWARGINNLLLRGSYQTSLASEFVFPLGYPDLALGTFLYIPRIEGKLFHNLYDVSGEFRKPGTTPDFRITTLGGELEIEMLPFMKRYLMLSMGVGAAYVPATDEYKIYMTIMGTPALFIYPGNRIAN